MPPKLTKLSFNLLSLMKRLYRIEHLLLEALTNVRVLEAVTVGEGWDKERDSDGMVFLLKPGNAIIVFAPKQQDQTSFKCFCIVGSKALLEKAD